MLTPAESRLYDAIMEQRRDLLQASKTIVDIALSCNPRPNSDDISTFLLHTIKQEAMTHAVISMVKHYAANPSRVK